MRLKCFIGRELCLYIFHDCAKILIYMFPMRLWVIEKCVLLRFSAAEERYEERYAYFEHDAVEHCNGHEFVLACAAHDCR